MKNELTTDEFKVGDTVGACLTSNVFQKKIEVKG